MCRSSRTSPTAPPSGRSPSPGSWRLLGIEVIGAGTALPAEVLEQARPAG
ncbi:hypothetical protein [Streptomyces purpurascens]|uniref:Uncharacterized protein n=1 Tax=Streptomyces purpurascens TaxID=1924 RepID=A0ABZ1MRE6_STREF